MTDNSKKVSELPTAANIAATDRLLILRSPSSSPSVRTINVSTFAANLQLSTSVPANSSSTGLPGTVAYDANYLYICVGTNTWKRAALSTWS